MTMIMIMIMVMIMTMTMTMTMIMTITMTMPIHMTCVINISVPGSCFKKPYAHQGMVSTVTMNQL